MHPTTQYAYDVVDRKILACEDEILACRRHIDDLERSKDDSFPYIFDETRADRLFDFFSKCRHVRGCFSGKPIELEPFQKFDIGCLFGWVDKVTGIRRFKTAYIREARGQAKSTLMSCIANYGMTSDAYYPPGKPELAKYESKPEVVCIAVDRGQADIVWGDARDIALGSPDINKRLIIQKTKISHKTRGGELRKLSKDTKNKDGGAPCIIIVDEYHDHSTSSVKDKTAFGKGKRAQSLEMIITTAGEDAENKPCKIEDDTVRKILRREIIAESYFGVIRQFDDNDDPHNEDIWPKSSPIFQRKTQYSDSIYAEMKNEHDLAFGSGDNSKIRQWMIKRANRWQAESIEKYFAGCMDKWKRLAVQKDDYKQLIMGCDSFFGVDLSKNIDLNAGGFVTRIPDGRYAVNAMGFIPEETATNHEHGDRVPYRSWAEQGWCVLSPGSVNDDRYLVEYMTEFEKDNRLIIKEICIDPYSARQFANMMQERGFVTIEIRQGIPTLSEPTKLFRELVLQEKIVHDGSPLLTWCLANAYEILDNNGNIKLSKKHKDDSQRIDLLAALINALTRAMIQEESIYTKRGMVSLVD